MSALDTVRQTIGPLDTNAWRLQRRAGIRSPSRAAASDVWKLWLVRWQASLVKFGPTSRSAWSSCSPGDHGVTAEGVSAYPSDVTAQMVYNFVRGGAAINVLARHVGARVIVVDMGVDAELPCLTQFGLKKSPPGHP